MSHTLSLLPEDEVQPQKKPQPLIVAIKNKEALYSCYMPQLHRGGLFIAAASLGSQSKNLPPPKSKVMILLSLLDDKQRKTIQGEVCWVASAQHSLGGVAGVGIHFDDNEAGRALKIQIENLLAGLKQDQRTQTF